MVSDFNHYSDGSPYFGLQRCRGGLSLLPESGESSLLGALHRMVSGSGDDHSSFYLWGAPIVDMFETRLDNKLEVFYSDTSQTIPSFRATPCRWIGFSVCCTCTPIATISLAIHIVIWEEAQVIPIIPWWPSRGWFPQFCRSLSTCQ